MVIINTISKLREELLNCLKRYDRCGLITHKNPDGDGLCCCLALQELFSASDDIKVASDIILEAQAPANFTFLNAQQKSITYDNDLTYPLIVVLDCQSPERVGMCKPLLDKAETIIVIDHHQPAETETPISSYTNKQVFFYNNHHSVSVGAIIFEALKDEFVSINSKSKEYCATNLYTTIINDTNNFTNSNTDSKVFSISSEITAMGIKPNVIVKQFAMSQTPAFYRFLGQSLSTIKTFQNDSVLFFHSTINMFTENGINSNDAPKMTDYLKNLDKNTEVIVYFREFEKNRYRLSLRSNDLDVNRIASIYGGGGHIRAAGCEISGNIENIQDEILNHINKQLNNT